VIFYAIASVFLALVGGILGVIPLPGPPSWLTDQTGPIADVFQGAAHLGAWFPVGLVFTVVLALAGIWTVAFVIKAGRMALSLVTGGGGGAG
jgi:hypothetical protein